MSDIDVNAAFDELAAMVDCCESSNDVSLKGTGSPPRRASVAAASKQDKDDFYPDYIRQVMSADARWPCRDSLRLATGP